MSIISSWVGVPAASSLTGVPSTPSPPRGLPLPRPRLNAGFPCKKLLILDSRLGRATGEGAEGRDGVGGGGDDNSLSFSQSLLLPGVSRLRLFPRVGLVLGVVGVREPLAAADSGEARVGGAEEELDTLCSREDKPGERKRDKEGERKRERENGRN